MFILSLPIGISIALAVIVSASFSVGLYFVVHRFWSIEVTDETKKTADTVATRIGVIHAVVLGMMFANVRVEYNEMIVAIESEASAIVRLYNALERQGGEELKGAREQLKEYVHFIVDEQWPALRELRFQPGDREYTGRGPLDLVWKELKKIEYKPGDLNLKVMLDQVENYRIQRLFDTKGKTLPVFWYIAILGYLFTLLTLSIPAPTLRRYILVSLYASMVAVVLLGVFVLTHPYSSAAGVSPDVFQWLLEGSSK
jgi:hypothetical protein